MFQRGSASDRQDLFSSPDESVLRVILIGPRASCALMKAPDHERAGCARSNDRDLARLRLDLSGRYVSGGMTYLT